MRGPGLLILGVLVAASPAWAQDAATPESTHAGAVVAADGGESSRRMDELIRRGDELARLRARGTTRAVIGGVMLGFGLIIGGISTVLWTAGETATGYANLGFNGWYQGAVAMDTIGFGLIGGGTALLAVGAGNIAEGKRPRLSIGPASLGAHF
jgi:hypothetical protein